MIGVYFGFYDLYSFPPAQFPKYCPDLNSFFLIKYFPSVFWGKHYSEDAESELKRGEKIGNLRGGMRGAVRKRFSANAPIRRAPRFSVFSGRFVCCDVCLYRRRADGVPRKSASVASDFLGLERRRLYIYTGTRRKPTRYSLSTKRYSTVHKSIYRFNACFLLFKVP